MGQTRHSEASYSTQLFQLLNMHQFASGFDCHLLAPLAKSVNGVKWQSKTVSRKVMSL